MPSWDAHIRVYLLLRSKEPEIRAISDERVEGFNNLMADADKVCGEHGVEHKPRPFSLACMLLMLFAEFGDIMINGMFTHASREKRYKVALDLLTTIKNKESLSQYTRVREIYIPSEILILAIMHYALDIFTDCMSYYGPLQTRCDIVIECTKYKLWNHINHMNRFNLKLTTEKDLINITEQIVNAFRRHCIYIDGILNLEFRRKGLIPGCNSDSFKDALLIFARKNLLSEVVCISTREPRQGKQLDIPAAALRAYNLVRRGQPIYIHFPITEKNPCLNSIIRLKFNNYTELCEFIKHYLGRE